MSGLNYVQLRTHIIQPTLKHIELWSPAAEEIVLGIAIQESGLHYLKQLGTGPALGLWQMEPATHNDIWTNFLKAKKHLAAKILWPYATHDPNRMLFDLAYACAMCRVHLYRCPAALPSAGDVEGQAAYWKKWYNTPLGAGTTAQYVASWNRFFV